MPTYEYKCDACGTAFEKFQSMTAAPVKKCPKCGKNKVRRLISTGAGLIFKGSGFYITDYRSDGYKSAAKNDSGTGGGESKPAEVKSGESKSADAPAAAKATEPAAPKSTESKTSPKKSD